MSRRFAALGLALVFGLLAAATALAAEPAAAYNGTPPAVTPNKHEATLLETINADRRQAGLPPLAWDATLAMVAREHSQDMVKQKYFEYRSPTLGSLEYRLRRAGVSCSTREVIYVLPKLEEIGTQLAKEEHPFHLEPDTHIGIGVERTLIPLGYTVTMIALQRQATLGPFPTRAEPRTQHRLRGRLAAGINGPHVTVTPPAGKVYDVKVREGADGAFEATVLFNHGTGKYTVQVGAKGDQGPVVTDTMPVYVGVAYPGPDDEAAEDDGDDANPEATMLRLLNRDRMANRLKPLRWSAALANVARAHSRDMADHHFFAHKSPATGEVSDRLKRAGIELRAFAENIALERTAAGAERGLMNSPGHRRNILTPEFEVVGIGIAFDGERRLYATQVFGREFEKVEPGAAAGTLADDINTARRKAGAGALKPNRDLGTVATANSRAMAAADNLGVETAQEELRKVRFHARYVQILVLVSNTAPTAAQFERALDRRYNEVAVGIVQQKSAQYGAHAIWTTILLVEK